MLKKGSIRPPQISLFGILALGSAFLLMKYGLRAKRSPMRLSPSSDRLQQLIDSCDVCINVAVQDGLKYLEFTYRGDPNPTRVVMPTGSVMRNRVCAYSAPTITIPPSTIAVAQSPGRKTIALFLNRGIFGTIGDVLFIIDDEDPSLGPDAMRVEIDIDPTLGVTWSKQIEAWTFCRGSRTAVIQADMIPIPFGTGIVCSNPGPGNDYRTGCTITQVMLLTRQDMDEMWFRKPGFLGFWVDAGLIDQTIWDAFGGRSVRFLWRRD